MVLADLFFRDAQLLLEILRVLRGGGGDGISLAGTDGSSLGKCNGFWSRGGGVVVPAQFL